MSATSTATSGGVIALPMRANAWVMPWAKPQRASGVHTDMARVAVGNVAPSPIPSASRAANSEASPPTAPVAAVAAHTISPQTPERRPRAELVGQPPAHQLEQGIRIGEGGKRQPQLRIGEREVGLDQ